MNNRYLLSAQRFIAAPPEDVFEVLASPALHSEIDGSDTVVAAQPSGPQRLSLGVRFGMEMNVVVGYKILSTVCEFEEGRRIAWQHFYGHVWRYILEPSTNESGQAGTLVTEQWDARSVRGRFVLRLAGYLRRHPANLERTLSNLDAYLSRGQAYRAS